MVQFTRLQVRFGTLESGMKQVSSQIKTDSSMLELLEGEYALVSLPPETALGFPVAGDLRIVIHDPVEITLIVLESAWLEMAVQYPQAKAQRGYRAIRLSQNFPLETVGVMAKLTQALAQAGVSIMAYSTFKSDVVLIRGYELNQALAAMWDLRF
jgi:hypothetical protein